jgi:hypothetical protein
MLAAAAAVPAAAVPARAQAPLPENNAGTGQYVEPVPDAGGNRPGHPHGGHRRLRLSPRARQAIPGGAEGRTLARLATDPGSGAPAGGGGGSDRTPGSRGSAHRGRGASAPGSAGLDHVTAASAVTSAAVGDDGGGVPVVLLGVVVLTLGASAAAIRRRRRRSR